MPHTKEPLMSCPECHDGYGQPKSVMMAAGQRTVRYACPTCGHEWNVTTPDRDRFLRRD